MGDRANALGVRSHAALRAVVQIEELTELRPIYEGSFLLPHGAFKAEVALRHTQFEVKHCLGLGNQGRSTWGLWQEFSWDVLCSASRKNLVS